MSKPVVRCAIYTRKSTEEGLEQEFNSLHAQREACEAYITSQRAESWAALKDQFDDGGFSGGTMERPALSRLLALIDKGLVDIVVVYKIDRLTRSLADFAKIVERFEKRNVSFVSVTQSFNTTSSMGRLTLNVLLSFAQFEREVTAERIRDKFLASRQKGIFMGGCPPLGYDARDRKLVINESEAETVKLIFSRYLALGSVVKLRGELDARGIHTKAWVSSSGKALGGFRWYVGSLRVVLRNRVYVGDAVHKGTAYPGQHEPILDRKLFDAVQAKLDSNGLVHRQKRTTFRKGLLSGILFDDRGNAMSPVTSRKDDGRAYLYYVSQARIQKREPDAMRPVPAESLEAIICEHIARLVEPGSNPTQLREHVRSLVTRIEIGDGKITVTLNADAVARHANAKPQSLQKLLRNRLNDGDDLNQSENRLIATLAASIPRRGGTRRVERWTEADWTTSRQRHDASLIKALAQANTWRQLIERGEVLTVEDLAAEVGRDRRHVRDTLKLAFLAPDIQRAVLTGRQPQSLTVARLGELDVPSLWSAQRTLLCAPGA
jgi:DNA invertase Pin-like site-specific DNA recombinase